MPVPSSDFLPAYKDRFLRTEYSEPLDYNDASCDSPVVFPDKTTPVTYPIELSQTQWAEIAACILQGAIIIYPNSVQRIYWNFARAVECDLMNCQWIIDCLTDPESGVSDAYTDWLIDQLQNNPDVQAVADGFGGDQTTPIDANDETLFTGCNNDLIFGFTTQMVDLIHTLIKDFYEIVETKTNFQEMVNLCASQVNAVTISLGWLEYMQNSVAEAYNANYTVALRNEYACELFCLATTKASCTLTWEDLTNYFAEKVSYSTSNTSLLDLLTFFLAGSWTGTQFCDISFLLVAFLMRIGASWTGTSLPLIQVIAQSYLNDPDSDWSTLCEDCVWEHTFSFLADDQVPPLDLTQVEPSYPANWASGQGWVSDEDATGARGGIKLIFPSNVTLTEATMTSQITTATPETRGTFIQLFDASDNSLGYYDTFPTGNGQVETTTGTIEIANVRKISFYSGANNPGASATCKEIVLKGLGIDPYPGSP